MLRLLGVRFGLPWFHHWDEGWVTDNTSHMLQTADWRPRIYQYGAPLSVLMGLTLRALSDLWPKHVFDPNDSVLMHLIGRIITVVISSSGAFATYVAARCALPGDRGARVRAVYAALSYATAAELVSHGRYAVTDANLVALLAWSLACGALFIRGGSARWAAATVGFAALAVAFKITAAPAMVLPFTLLLFRRRFKLLLIYAPASAVVFFLLNPHVLLHWNIAWGDILVRINQYRDGRVPEFLVRHAGVDHALAIAHALVFWVFHRTPWASAIMALLAAYGLALAVRARSLVCVGGLVHAVIVLGGMAMTRAFLIRNYLIVLPVCCIGFGFAMQDLHERIARLPDTLRETRLRYGHVVLAWAFAGMFVLVPTVQAVRTEALVTDARVRAIDWISSRAGTKATVACTSEIGVDATGYRKDAVETLKRPNLVMMTDVENAGQVETGRPDFVVVVSHPDFFGSGDLWPFKQVRGYRNVAEVDSNPYEHNCDITPTWMGRFNTIILERQRE